MLRDRCRGERGATAVEFALVVPLLIVLVIGIAEFGHAFQVQGTLSAAARAAVRNAAASLDPGITDRQIRISPASCPVLNGGSTSVRLTIDYRMPYLTGFFGTGVDLTGTGVMRCNG